MMKKILAALLCAALLFALAACSGGSGNGDTTDTGSDTKGGDNKKNIKIGVILIGDENEGYTYAHIEGIKEAMKENNISEDQVVWKYNIPENEQCKETAEDLAEQGCTAIFSNSYNHQTYMQQVAGEPGYEDITFVSATGDTAANRGLKNFKNCFTKVYESRYVSGIVAGMKLAELVKDGKIADSNKDADGNIKIGYVGAYPYAEVVSGYTAFYLGIKSVIENVVMEVQYTQSWFDIAAEGQAAKALMADGCIIIGQHADSTGAPAEVQAAYDAGTVAYSIGYNVDMLSVAPKAALTSATNIWAAYYTYAFGQLLKGEDIDTDWAKGYSDDAVAITALGESCAEGTQEKVDEAIAAIKAGTLHVFDINTFTVDGKKVESCIVDLDGDFKTDSDADKEAIWDGYFHESELRAAPSFTLRIDGITELNAEG